MLQHLHSAKPLRPTRLIVISALLQLSKITAGQQAFQDLASLSSQLLQDLQVVVSAAWWS